MLDQELLETCPCCGANNADPVTGEWVCDAAAPCCSVACLDVILAEMREADSAHADALAEEADIAREWRASRAAGRAAGDETAHYRCEG